MAYIDFVYGLAFFSLGLVIGLESLRPIADDVKPALRNLALFGLLYGVHQWIELFELTLGEKTHIPAIVISDIAVMALAVVCLARFGGRLITDDWTVVTGIPVALAVLWFAALMLNLGSFSSYSEFHVVADGLDRYILLFPANLMAAWGMWRGRLTVTLESAGLRSDRVILSGLFVANAFFSGLAVEQAPFFPADRLNVDALGGSAGLTVGLIRAALAVGITVFMVRALRAFEFLFIKERLAKETLELDAKVAAEIQTELVPKDPLFIDGAAIYARMLPARLVGGDTFEYFDAAGSLTFMIGDASGKGPPAALLCTAGLITLETELRSTNDPKTILSRANKRLVKRFPSGSFMTAAMGRFLPRERVIELASAGQNPPLIYRFEDAVWRVLELGGSLPLGVGGTAEPTEIRLSMRTGDRLLYYTDGLIDVRDTDGRRIDFDAIMKWLNARGSAEPSALLDDLIALLLDFSEGNLFDDVTLLLIDVDDNISTSARSAA